MRGQKISAFKLLKHRRVRYCGHGISEENMKKKIQSLPGRCVCPPGTRWWWWRARSGGSWPPSPRSPFDVPSCSGTRASCWSPGSPRRSFAPSWATTGPSPWPTPCLSTWRDAEEDRGGKNKNECAKSVLLLHISRILSVLLLPCRIHTNCCHYNKQN